MKLLRRIYSWIRGKPLVWLASIAAVVVGWIVRRLFASGGQTTTPPASLSTDDAVKRRDEIRTEYESERGEIKDRAESIRDRIRKGRGNG